ncbi:MAG: hypothetical protein R3B81_04850 [bacterium]
MRESDTSERVDLVADGHVIHLYVNDDGHVFFVSTPPGGTEQSWTGTWWVDGGSVVLQHDGYSFSWEFDAAVGEHSMTLTGAHAEWDFDEDGSSDPAIWNLAGEN